MTRLAVAAALTLAVLAAGCGRYGAPHRVRPPAPAAETAPVTDPAVAR
jgi:PBP1b-binding outer membrane lipoprotein LpoB